MRTLLVIGIGSGNPEHITIQAIKALNRTEVFFAFDKGAATSDLLNLRREICRTYITDRDYRFVEVTDPERDRTPDAYRDAVVDWHEERAIAYEAVIDAELGPDGVGALLVWGDPALYDSTIRIVQQILERGRVSFDYEVIPGISSVQVLAAQHRTVLNGIGEPIHITTGRQLPEAVAAGERNIVVMLDGKLACRDLPDQDFDIRWGANLGTPAEVLLSGPLPVMIDQIVATRAELKARTGWIMDTYLLRRPAGWVRPGRPQP
ncbi:precorrin-6A synthase (deacetylating) [Nakamurella silvestris]|nr:precorrin-6A synthase (deacetylating) [Nakamurella silvestris]